MLGPARSLASFEEQAVPYTPSQLVCDGKTDNSSCSESSQKCTTATIEDATAEENKPFLQNAQPGFIESISEQADSFPLNADFIFSLVNKHRLDIGLPVFQKDDRICHIAQVRAPQISNEILTRTMHNGFFALNLPYFATENIIAIQTEQEAVNWWLHSPVHRHAIENDYVYSCVACSGKSCSEIFTNFEAKLAINNELTR